MCVLAPNFAPFSPGELFESRSVYEFRRAVAGFLMTRCSTRNDARSRRKFGPVLPRQAPVFASSFVRNLGVCAYGFFIVIRIHRSTLSHSSGFTGTRETKGCRSFAPSSSSCILAKFLFEWLHFGTPNRRTTP